MQSVFRKAHYKKVNYDIFHFMVMVTAKAFQLSKIHMQALQKTLMCRTCSETSCLSFAKFQKTRKRYFGERKAHQ